MSKGQRKLVEDEVAKKNESPPGEHTSMGEKDQWGTKDRMGTMSVWDECQFDVHAY